jgi:hypothetical protein
MSTSSPPVASTVSMLENFVVPPALDAVPLARLTFTGSDPFEIAVTPVG